MCVYNEEDYVKESVSSVLNQSLEDFELIIINDGSNDNTLNILNEFDDERIKVFSWDNKGLGASRNYGLDLASGDYVMFLDGDDYFVENALEIAYNEASSNNTDLSFFKIINYSDKFYESDWFSLNSFDESFDNIVFNSTDTHDFLFDMSVSACQKIYKKSFLKDISARFPEGIHFEDMPFFYYVYLSASRISIIRDFLYVRRKHSGSITDSVDNKFLDTVKAGQILMDIFIENEWYDAYVYDLLAYKINGPRYALMSIDGKYAEQLFSLIKKDYNAIKSSKYYEDYMSYLGPIKKKFFTDILKAKNYEEFLKINKN